jgi:hypothetical protein
MVVPGIGAMPKSGTWDADVGVLAIGVSPEGRS